MDWDELFPSFYIVLFVWQYAFLLFFSWYPDSACRLTWLFSWSVNYCLPFCRWRTWGRFFCPQNSPFVYSIALCPGIDSSNWMSGAKAFSKIEKQNAQDKLSAWFLHCGDETLKSWKPMLNTILSLRLIGTFSAMNADNLSCAFCQSRYYKWAFALTYK